MNNLKKSGFVTIIGKPNVGKSTLLNSLIGQQLSVVTPKPQTTRNNIVGILTKDAYQIIFLDTPGILEPKYKLQSFMKREIDNSFLESDLILIVIDSSRYDINQIRAIIEEYQNKILKKPTFCILNKIDLVNKAEILHIINDASSKYEFTEIFPISAKKNYNTKELLDCILKYIPTGEFYFDGEIIASQPERFFVSEIIRGEVINLCKDEIPFSVYVEIEEFYERDNGKDYIRVNLILDKDSHKKIIIGKNGMMVKKIGTISRKKVESFLGKEIFLEMFVKVKKNWRNDDNFLTSHFKSQTFAS